MRVRRHVDFEQTVREGLRVSDQRIALWARPNGRDYPRLGLIVGVKYGPAVRRNRAKRVLREAFRLAQHELPAGLDLICAPRVGVDLELEGCRESLLRLAGRLAARLALD